MSLTVTVLGTPAPQGSKRHVGNGVMVESSKAVGPWREAVRNDARAARDGAPPITGPVIVEAIFTVPKPRSAPKRRRTWPDRRPDVDKLARAALDGIVAAGVIRDDAQVVEIVAAKRYPGEGLFALPSPGAWIRITEVTA